MLVREYVGNDMRNGVFYLILLAMVGIRVSRGTVFVLFFIRKSGNQKPFRFLKNLNKI